MRVVLDTNVILVSIPSKSKYRPIFDGLIKQKFELYISNEILSEYTEIIETKTTNEIAVNVVELLLTLPSVYKIQPSYNWNLIHEDLEDNKFVDCAIHSSADYLVTNDSHFEVLKSIDFPEVRVISIDDFLKIAQNLIK